MRHTIECLRQDGESRGIDFDAHFQAKGWHGIAFYLLGWAADWETPMPLADEECEPELVPDYDRVVAVMVGDDKRHLVDVSDLIELPEDGFCRDCGQVGCRCNVYA